jgi:hypothetical protein
MGELEYSMSAQNLQVLVSLPVGNSYSQVPVLAAFFSCECEYHVQKIVILVSIYTSTHANTRAYGILYHDVLTKVST